jgi:hypothetical protein
MNSRLFIYTLLFISLASCKKEAEVIYDEADVPKYTLPEILISEKGDSIKSSSEWTNLRKKEILNLFSSEVYGKFPDMEYSIEFEEKLFPGSYFNGSANIKEILATVTTENGSDSFSMLYIFPANKKEVSVFVGLNFKGNHTIDTLSLISVHKEWVADDQRLDSADHKASTANRGSTASRWPIQTIIDKGYGLLTAYYGAFDPDYDDGFLNGFHPLFAEHGKVQKSNSPGSISIWAKGMSLMVDYLVQDSIADHSGIIAIGHSRLGKTALWSAANDDRYSAVISNNSGCGGAALSRRSFGETVERINTVFPHWFCDKFTKYNGMERKLPVDQHMLLALMAPRPLYVASASEDKWADPMGEYLSLKEVLPVYKLFGITQNFPERMPNPNIPYDGVTAYHIRSGKHDITAFDWIMYMNWCDKWLSN